MRFKNIKINQWKQFQDIDIDFHEQLTVLTGANGSGKTTLLNLLARNFGWQFSELATPAKEKSNGIIRFFARLFRNNEQINDNIIGSITYDNDAVAKLSIPNTNTAMYQVLINNPQQVKGINILSHRNVFKYQPLPSIVTQKRNRKDAYQLVEENTKTDTFKTGYYEHKPINFLIKETLLNWALGGNGNEFIQPDNELRECFIGFQNILKIIMPKSIGFKEISIRNYEIVLITESGDFMLDAVSGGIASLIDLAWQIYNFSETRNEKIVALIKETKGKCMYCESFISAVAPEHIEHYRPKAIYPQLTFDWANLGLACPWCNIKKKTILMRLVLL
jgi:energy-coupling factor transporter ATP-binding protein EcfA2